MAKLDPKADKFLKGLHFGKIATLMKDGRPQLTPVWYKYEDGKIIINTTKERTKYRNIVRDKRISFLVDDGYPYITIFGRARVATERDPHKDIEDMAVKYHGEKKGRKQARDVFDKQNRVSIEIVPEKVVVDL